MMQEELIDFKEIVKKYYEDFGKPNMVFDFLHVNINYTYIDLHHNLVDLDSTGKPILNNGKRVRKELVAVPIVVDQNNYLKLFSNDGDYSKRTFNIDDNLDLGTSYLFNYKKVYEEIKKVVPEDCHIISYDEVKRIALMNGYENIYWNINDENDCVLAIYDLEPVWTHKVYGIKNLENEKTL